MTTRRLVNILVLLFFAIGGIYYTVVHNDARGALVVLLGILYFEALPHIS